MKKEKNKKEKKNKIIPSEVNRVKEVKAVDNIQDDRVELRAVLWTDGSTYPTNPGKSGAGIHGYTYNFYEKCDKPNRIGKFLVTNKGYLDNLTAVNYISNYKSDDVRLKVDKAIAQKALFTEEYNYKIVNPLSFIEGYVSLEEATNNVAELYGTLEAIRFCLNVEKDIKHITIFTDSNYVVNACFQINACLNRHVLYMANKNKEIIDEIQDLHKEARKKGIVITVQWVKGHADNIGNIKADILADIGREASLTDLVYIKDYEYSEYFNAPKLDALILDNFTKIIDSKELIHTIENDDNKLDITYGIYNKDINSNGKALLPSSYVSLITNNPDRELIKIKRDIHKLYLSKARAHDDEYINVINLKELLAEEVLVYTNKYGYDLSLDIDNGKIKLLGDNINTIATTSKNGNKLLTRMILDLNQLFDNHLSRVSKYVFSKNNKKLDVIDITNTILNGSDLIIKDSESFEYKDEKYFIPKVFLGINIPEYKTLKKLSKKIDKILLTLDNDMYTISVVLKNKSNIDILTYLNPTNSICYLVD